MISKLYLVLPHPDRVHINDVIMQKYGSHSTGINFNEGPYKGHIILWILNSTLRKNEAKSSISVKVKLDRYYK